MVELITIPASTRGLHEITSAVTQVVAKARSGLSGNESGLCTIFLQHTSASLLIQENADPSAKHDLQAWLDRLVPENDPLFTHTDEGPDDMPSHIKAALTATSISIPIIGGKLGLGRWQGIYLWEHRRAGRERSLLVHVGP